MAKKAQQLLPLSEIDRDQIILKCLTSADPMTATELVKANVATRKVTAAEVSGVLDEYVATGRLHLWPAKSAKGQPRYWGREASSVIHDGLLEICRQMEEPLTAKELLKKLKVPLKVTENDLTAVLEQLIQSSKVYPIPGAGKKGKSRYWSHDANEYSGRAIKQLLTEKGSQPESALKKALNWLNVHEFQNLVDRLISTGEIRRYPKLGKNETFGVLPPRAYPYLQDVQSQLTKIVAALVAAGVSPSELRRATVQLMEEAGITFGEAAQAATTVDLISRDRQERKLIEGHICRLGAKARAAGIHLILATQEPSRDTIKGQLDSNMPARVGLKMGKALESNMLLNMPGAENLLGHGDLLFKAIGSPRRLQAPLLSDANRLEIFGSGK